MLCDAEKRRLFPSGIPEEYIVHILKGGEFPNKESKDTYRKVSFVKLWGDETLIKPNYREAFYKHYSVLLFYLEEAFIFYINGEIEAGNEVQKVADGIEDMMLAEVTAVGA